MLSSPDISLSPGMAPPSGKLKSVELSAAGNEFEPFQLLLRPAKDVNGLKIEPRSFVGPNGAKIEAWNVTIYYLPLYDSATFSSMSNPPHKYSDNLLRKLPDAASVKGNAYWVSVYIPSGAKPGDYSGSVDVSAAGVNKISVPVKLHVWNFQLPTVSKLRTAFDFDLTSVASYVHAGTLEEKRKLIDIYNLELWKHRVSPFAPYTFYEIKTSLEGEKIKLDFTEFDKAVALYFAKINAFNLPDFGAGSDFGLGFGKDYDRLKVEYMRAVIEHLADKGQAAKAFDCVVHNYSPDKLDAIKQEYEFCGQADSRIKVMCPCQIEKDLIGCVDIWAVPAASLNVSDVKARQAKREQVWLDVTNAPGLGDQMAEPCRRAALGHGWRGNTT